MRDRHSGKTEEKNLRKEDYQEGKNGKIYYRG